MFMAEVSRMFVVELFCENRNEMCPRPFQKPRHKTISVLNCKMIDSGICNLKVYGETKWRDKQGYDRKKIKCQAIELNLIMKLIKHWGVTMSFVCQRNSGRSINK